jgi:hypothetical protein
MGGNAVRTSHNMPTPEWVEACDHLGMMMMCETRMMSSTTEGIAQLETMIKRYRNSPAIILWSMGNEEWIIQGKSIGEHIVASMVTHSHLLDPTRLCSAAINDEYGSGISLALDVEGINYNLDKIDAYHREHPRQPLIGTETGSTTSTRGVYITDKLRNWMPAYDTDHPAWSELDDYLAHRIPDPHAPGRLDRAREMLALHGDKKYCVALICPALFERQHFLRGMENTFCDFASNEHEVERLLEALCDNLVELIREWGQTKISGYYLTDDWGSQTGLMVSPALWKKYFRGHYRRIIDEIHRQGKDVIFHSCGNVMRLVPELIDLGVDILDPIQPKAMNLDEVGRQFGGKVAFCGGIDDQRLEDMTPQQVKDAVRHAIDVLGKPYGNAYILAPANTVTPSVPFENIQALFEACHEQ